MRLLAYCRRRCWPSNALNQAACRVEHKRRARATFARCLARFAGNVFNAVRCLITDVWRSAAPAAISKQTHKQRRDQKIHAFNQPSRAHRWTTSNIIRRRRILRKISQPRRTPLPRESPPLASTRRQNNRRYGFFFLLAINLLLCRNSK